MTYRPDFNGIRAKIDRAIEHHDALKAEVEPVIRGERHLVRISPQIDADTGEHVFYVTEMPDPFLRRTGLIVGDIVHNLRAALDHLVWQLALHHSKGQMPRDIEKIKFPIRDKRVPGIQRRDFAKTSSLREVPPRHRAMIELLQPYYGWYGGKHPLTVLQDLSNTDKHRVINPVLVFIRGGFECDPPLRGVSHIPVSFHPGRKRLKLREEVMRGTLPGHIDFDTDTECYAVPQIELPERSRVLKTTHEMERCVTDIVRKFQKRF